MTEKAISATTVLQQLQWRYATKKFDPDRKTSAGEVIPLESVALETSMKQEVSSKSKQWSLFDLTG
ncbi:hypothetical protein [Thermosynechococcus sp.]|uniref:hypothetical protein n=1 Tax=Thermosynechococcus sp. TaxID=2814275 RepID=UPI003918DC1E